MTTLNPLAVANAALLRELLIVGEARAATVSDLARRLGRDESNLRKTLKALTAEGLTAPDPMIDGLTDKGAAQLAAIDRAEGQGGEPGSPSATGPAANGMLALYHAQILPDPANARRDWDSDEAKADLDALREDLLLNGLLQNLVVRAVPEGDLQGVSIERTDAGGARHVLPLYRLVGGERRWRAIAEAISDGDWPEDRLIPCRELDADDLGCRLAALAENIQRRNLNPIEKARAFEGLAEAGLSNQQIAERIGATPEHVQQHRRFLQLDDADQQRMTLPKDDPRHLSVRDARQKLAKKGEDEVAGLQIHALARLAWVELTDAAYRHGRYGNLWNSVVVAPGAAASPEGVVLAEIGAITFEGMQKYNHVGRFTAKRDYCANAIRLDPPLPAGLMMGDEARNEALREEQRLALGDAAPEWPEGDVAYATPWLADPGELTPEGLAMVEADQAEQRAWDEAENARQAAIAERDARWAAARARHVALFAEAVDKPVWGEPAQTVEIAAEIDRPLPWAVSATGKVMDANGQQVVAFGHYTGCSDQGLVTARMIVAAVNAAGGLATPADVALPEPDEDDEPEQDINGDDPDPHAPALGSIWTQPMIDLEKFAFLTRIDATTKPTVFPDLHHLARHIERKRLAEPGDRAIQLEEVEDLQFAGQPGLHTGVQVWLLDMAHERETSLGYAWLKGEGRERLEPILRIARRDLGGRQAAAA